MPPASLSPSADRAFFADSMLGRLARWLRILGYDTAYEKVITDDKLVTRVLAENRWLLTRDRYLARRRLLRGRHSLIVDDDINDQLRQLQRELHLRLCIGEETCHRCADCNTGLIPIQAKEAAPLVPPFVAAHYPTFILCPACRRVFWPGTQWRALLGRLAAIKEGPARP
jgi:uncharacterized protein with PIN domain